MDYTSDVKERVCSFDSLHKAMKICRREVMWKESVSSFVNNGLVNCFKLRRDLLNGTYNISHYTIFYIYEPKKRKIVSTRIRDRVFQRSLCDNYLTHQITKSFIYDNCACQVNKGTDFARNRLETHLHQFYREHGVNGYVLKCDISDFFGSTRHDIAKAAVRKRVDDPWVIYHVDRIIDSFNDGPDPNVGMGLGSQVTQLIQLAILDDMDHYIKEVLGIKHYVRYMDDFILIHEDKEYLQYCKQQIINILTNLHLRLSKKKTQIAPVTQNIHFLGFSFRLTETGAVVRTLLSNKVSKERRKLKKQVGRAKAGIMTRDEVDSCFTAWKSHAAHGDTYNLVIDISEFYDSIWRAA